MRKKIKTKKTLLKRVKITKGGKLLKKKLRTSHLKSKWSTNRRFRKSDLEEITCKGYIKKFKSLLGVHSKGL